MVEPWGNDTGPEIARFSEQIFACWEEQKKLELLISEEHLRYQYVLKRRELLRHELLLLIGIVFGIAIFVINTIGTFLVFFDLLLTAAWFFLLARTIRLLLLFIFSMDTPWLSEYAENHGMNTFQRQEKESSAKIAAYHVQLENLKMKRSVLILRRKDLLNKKPSEPDTKEEQVTSSTGFKLKQRTAPYDDERVLFEFYEKEEHYLMEQCSDCEIEIHNLEKEIREIDLSFEKIKKSLYVFVGTFVMLAAIQGALHGTEADYFGAFCLVTQFGLIFYLVKTCKKPILLYLVEHESHLVEDYAFVHGLFPVKKKLDDKKGQLDEMLKELQKIREQKKNVL